MLLDDHRILATSGRGSGCRIFLWDTTQTNAGKPRKFTFLTNSKVRTNLPRTTARVSSHLTPFHRDYSGPIPSVITIEEKLDVGVYKSYAITVGRLCALTEKFVPGLSDLPWDDWKDSLTPLGTRTGDEAVLGPSDGYRFYMNLMYTDEHPQGSQLPIRVYDFSPRTYRRGKASSVVGGCDIAYCVTVDLISDSSEKYRSRPGLWFSEDNILLMPVSM
jgi:hypothetical protein